MREIEVKARIPDMEALLGALKNADIELSEPLKQHDRVFALPGSADNAFDANWLRIRIEDDTKTYFTLKRSVVGHLDSIEHETVVEDAGQLESIIALLGYEPYSELTKVRRKGRVGKIELCVDEVPGIGAYIEAEALHEADADHDVVVQELWQLLESFGVTKDDEETRGYDVIERARRQA